jgi:hypothetical protein
MEVSVQLHTLDCLQSGKEASVNAQKGHWFCQEEKYLPAFKISLPEHEDGIFLILVTV